MSDRLGIDGAICGSVLRHHAALIPAQGERMTDQSPADEAEGIALLRQQLEKEQAKEGDTRVDGVLLAAVRPGGA